MEAAAQIIELGKLGLVGIIMALIGLVGFTVWMLWKVTTNHIEHTNEAFNKNTEALVENTEIIKGLKEFIQLIVKK